MRGALLITGLFFLLNIPLGYAVSAVQQTGATSASMDEIKMVVLMGNQEIKTYCDDKIANIMTKQEEFYQQGKDEVFSLLEQYRKDFTRKLVLGVLAGCMLGWSIAALSSVALKKKQVVL